MILENEAMVTQAALKALANTRNPRLKAIFESLVRHAHAFAREVRLTEEELHSGLRTLAEFGHYTTDTRNEMVQLSDILGISSLVSLMHHPLSDIESPATVMGPFYRGNAPEYNLGGSIVLDREGGEQLVVRGTCRSSDDTPLPGALLDIWQASPAGFYENQQPTQPDMNFRGRFRTDPAGEYRFVTLMPAGYPVPTDGPLGRVLEAQGRHAFRPAHIHFIVSAPGHATLITQLYLDDEKALNEDVVLAVTRPLVGSSILKDTIGADTPDGVQTPYRETTFDFKLAPGTPTFPVPPIA